MAEVDLELVREEVERSFSPDDQPLGDVLVKHGHDALPWRHRRRNHRLDRSRRRVPCKRWRGEE